MKEFACPECQEPSSFLRIMSYPPPTTFKCKGCGRRLQVNSHPAVTAAVVTSVLLGYSLALYGFSRPFGFSPIGFLAGAVLAVVILEIAIYMAFVSYKIHLEAQETFLSRNLRYGLPALVVVLCLLTIFIRILGVV
jgi:hypothetical protein